MRIEVELGVAQYDVVITDIIEILIIQNRGVGILLYRAVVAGSKEEKISVNIKTWNYFLFSL